MKANNKKILFIHIRYKYFVRFRHAVQTHDICFLLAHYLEMLCCIFVFACALLLFWTCFDLARSQCEGKTFLLLMFILCSFVMRCMCVTGYEILPTSKNKGNDFSIEIYCVNFVRAFFSCWECAVFLHLHICIYIYIVALERICS